MTKVYLVRHAEAEGNLYRRIHGWYDSLITDKGYRQIKALSKRFEGVAVDAVYSSDLFRTQTTARAVAEPRGMTVSTDKGLREVNMGIWEDHTWGEIGHSDTAQILKFSATDPTWQVEGGETFEALRDRISRSILRIAGKHDGQTIALFCHGTAIRNALAVFLGMSIEESAKLTHSDNTAVSYLEIEGDKVDIIFHDDASHLDETTSTFAKQKWWKQDTGSMADANVEFQSLDMRRDGDFYRQCRGEAWMDIHGSWDNYDEEAFYQDALAQWMRDKRSVQVVLLNKKPMGILQMDVSREADRRVGYIPFVYLCPEYRHRGLGIQLIGQAVSTYRPMGRDRLRLRCAPDNEIAQKFYGAHGFTKVGEDAGSRVPLDILEKDISYNKRPIDWA